MLRHPDFSPIFIDFGTHTLPVLGTVHPQIHWYGMMYLGAFLFAYWFGRKSAREGRVVLSPEQVDDVIFYGALGVILGGRIGYVLFYGMESFLQNPLWALEVWQGGMSFHGGFLGVVLAMVLYARYQRLPIGGVFDFAAMVTPIGLGLGRLGNFIGQELWGRPTDLPWGMVFPRDPSGLARHPSQLYQAFLEGAVLFTIIYWYTRKPRPQWSTGALFVCCYGVFRFVVEFVREPDAHIGFDLFGWMSRGQILSLPMIIVGIMVMIWAYRRPAVK